MKNVALKSDAEKLPDHLQYLNQRKKQAESFAEAIASEHPKLSERILNCSNDIKVRAYSNGATALHSAWYCRVRGCPMCEPITRRKRAARVAAGYREFRALRPTGVLFAYDLPIGCVPVCELRSSHRRLRAASRQMLQRSSFKGHSGSISLSNLDFFGEQVGLSLKVVCGFPGRFKGKRYISLKTLQSLWDYSNQSPMPPVSTSRVKTLNSLMQWLRPSFGVHTEDWPSELASEYLSEALGLKFLITSGLFKIYAADRQIKPQRLWYPSEQAACDRIKYTRMSFLPDMHSQHFFDCYQSYEDTEEELSYRD